MMRSQKAVDCHILVAILALGSREEGKRGAGGANGGKKKKGRSKKRKRRDQEGKGRLSTRFPSFKGSREDQGSIQQHWLLSICLFDGK